MPKKLHVLHVVEALGGGVASALEAYIQALPHVSHSVLGQRREGMQTGDRIADLVDGIDTWEGGHLAGIRAVTRAVARLRPDIVHAHSALAGCYVRCAPTVRARSIMYTPHCYAFEREDVAPAVKAAYRAVERLLAPSTGAVIACSPREAELAHQLRPGSRIHYVPNVADLPDTPTFRPEERRGPHRFDGTVTVATVGRVCPQKDPAFFAAAARHSAMIAPEIRWLWLGGGDAESERLLTTSGVHVSGWLSRNEALTRMTTVTGYVHAAAWEGAPISVLEAAALDLPIVGRRIPALESLGLTGLADTPQQLAERVAELRDPSVEMASRTRSRALHSRHQPRAQSAALGGAYRLAPQPARG